VDVFVSGERVSVGSDNRHSLPTNKPTTAGNTSTSAFIQKPEAATAV
jgi:hypothetical protein